MKPKVVFHEELKKAVYLVKKVVTTHSFSPGTHHHARSYRSDDRDARGAGFPGGDSSPRSPAAAGSSHGSGSRRVDRAASARHGTLRPLAGGPQRLPAGEKVGDRRGRGCRPAAAGVGPVAGRAAREIHLEAPTALPAEDQEPGRVDPLPVPDCPGLSATTITRLKSVWDASRSAERSATARLSSRKNLHPPPPPKKYKSGLHQLPAVALTNAA